MRCRNDSRIRQTARQGLDDRSVITSVTFPASHRLKHNGSNSQRGSGMACEVFGKQLGESLPADLGSASLAVPADLGFGNFLNSVRADRRP